MQYISKPITLPMQFPTVAEVLEIANLIGQDFEEVYDAAVTAYFDMNNLNN